METTIAMDLSTSILQAVPMLLNFPKRRFWVDYDQEADVLYIGFRHPQKATNTRMTDDGLLLRYHGNQLVGVTILEASSFRPASNIPL